MQDDKVWLCHSQDVYAEDLVHRMPADASTMSPIEKAFEGLASRWVEAEACSGAAASPDLGCTSPDVEVQEVNASGASGTSFTRVMIGNVTLEVLRQIANDPGGRELCRYVENQPRTHIC